MIGSRNCRNLTSDDIARTVPNGTTLILSGGAAGADTLAEQAAQKLGIPFRKILPDYKTYGRRAPLIRNEEIVRQADRVFAFWDYESLGTAHAIAYCIAIQTPVEVIGLD